MQLIGTDVGNAEAVLSNRSQEIWKCYCKNKPNRGEVAMSFSAYKTIADALKAFQVIYAEANFIVEMPFQVADYFREDLQLMMREGVVDNSEFAICENLIYPVLKEVWKLYRHHFILWSHQSLNCNADLSGFPEYIYY